MNLKQFDRQRWRIALAAVLLATSPSFAVDIPIENASFEAQPVAMGCFAVFLVDGWDVFDPNGIVDQNFDVVGGIHPEGGPYFSTPTPDGDHAAIVFLGTDIGGGPAGLRQVLSETLQANQRYTLSVEIGDIDSGQGPPPCDVFGFFNLDGFPGYQVQLLAGGEIIAEDDNSLAPIIDDGLFLPSVIEATVDVDHPQIGQPLEIRLVNLNMPGTPEEPGIEVDFDDVRLVRECGATGDIDGSGLVDTTDVEFFVDVLLDSETDAVRIGRSDLDCSGGVDGADISAMVGFLLG